MGRKYVTIAPDTKKLIERDFDADVLEQSSTVCTAGEDIDCSARAQFVQIGADNTIIRARTIVHGVILESVTTGDEVTVYLPNFKLTLPGLITGSLYALKPSNNSIVLWDEVTSDLLPLGLALWNNGFYFVDRWFPYQQEKFEPDLRYLFCDNESPDDEFEEPDLDYLFCDNETVTGDFVPLLSQLFSDADFGGVKNECEETLSSGITSTLTNWVDANLSAYSGNFVGILIRNNEIWYAERGSFNRTTQVHIASVGKHFAATVLLILVEKGVFASGLNTTAGSLISDLSSAGKGSMTLKQLMSHTSGFDGTSTGTGGVPWEDQGGITSAAAVAGIAANHPLSHTPGTYYSYGGVHWCIAARMAEVATGKTWTQICQSEVWSILGMTATDYKLGLPGEGDPTNPIIHAGLRTTMADWAKFLKMRLKKGVHSGFRLLSEAAVLSMEVDQTGIGVGYGFGLYPDAGNNEAFHHGATGGVSFYNRTKKYAGAIFTTVYGGTTTDENDTFRGLARSNLPAAPECGTTPLPVETEHSRKVLLHNPVEMNWGDPSSSLPWLSKAKIGGVTYMTVLIDWWDIETGYNIYDFRELARRLDFLISQKLKFVIQLPRRYACVDDPDTASGKSSAYLGLANAILLRSGNRAKHGITGTTGSIFNAYYVQRLQKLTARIAHFIRSNATYRANCGPGLFINGGSEETGFFTAEFGGAFDDGDYSIEATQTFRGWLPQKYGSISNLNTNWGTGFTDFDQINPTDYRPAIYGSTIDYAQTRRQRDWFNFLCEMHQNFYGQVKFAWRNPRSIDSSLPVFSDGTTDTKFQLAAYWTENLNAAQGLSWGAAVVSMLQVFDVIFSSSGSTDGPPVGSNRFKSYAFRMAMLHALGVVYGQEMDRDNLSENGGRIGPSRLARVAFDWGAEWLIYVFYDETTEWDETGYLGIDGATHSFMDDAKLAYDTYVRNQERSILTISSTVSYGASNYQSLESIFNNVSSPNGVVAAWLSAVSPDSNGLSSSKVDVLMRPIPTYF
ncbi:serine hydrolase [Runella sp.]|uniref:serine hydrolase domain-containing protein n=1 Tax=Runella sp. TaxID=1960881 RepID=UPI003D105E19